MEQKYQIPTTQRAYTLRLRGADPQDNSWRGSLWKTHDAVNKGAKAFGDWLLTMRGGLCHTLADTRDKRIVLALSWLSVESPVDSVPKNYVVARYEDSAIERKRKLEDTLCGILSLRGVDDADVINQWVEACRDSLSADIRKDAVWVNRSRAFDEEVKKLNGMLMRDDALSVVEEFFGKSHEYLAPLFSTEDSEDSDKSASASNNEKEFSNVARGWLSRNCGAGNKTDKRKIAANLKKIVESDLEIMIGKPVRELFYYIITTVGGHVPEDEKEYYSTVKRTIGWSTGRDTKGVLILKSLATKDYILQEDISRLRKKFNDEITEKDSGGSIEIPDWMANKRIQLEQDIGINFRNSRDLIGEFSVMLDHAARRVSLAHTWIKRAEAERRRFEEDASKKGRVPAEAKNWLDRFCETRSLETGSIEPYRIRKRAVDGWDEVIKKWSKSECKTETDRIAAARSLQDDQEIDKFGDVQLFEALASDDAVCVWKINDKTDPQPLRDYVAATDAEAKMLRFKVPAYRHPDQLLHPVFCDFGNSRWNISFAMHEAVKKGKKPADKHALSMKLWTGSEVKDVDLKWQSKLLDEDLSFPADGDGKAVIVPRSSRLCRAAVGAPKGAAVSVAGLFEQKDWNGRLQAPRRQLKELSKYVAEHGWADRARSMRDRIRWIITFSAKLQPMGPWVEFAQSSNLKPNPKYWPHREVNKKRNGLSRLILSRLPGLRLLSVDFGHRYAAACAVWEAISSEEMRAVCRKAGLEPPNADLYLHLKSPDGKKTVIYRRIGADAVKEIDKNTGESKEVPHPAPWGRLDRQFLIKLQGEEEDARKASPAERDAVLRLEKELGRVSIEERSWKVDELMSETVRTLRLALRRHGDRARIAYNLTATKKMLPGGREESLTEEDRIELLTDTLAKWHDIAIGKNWADEWAKVKWDEYINPLLNGVELPQTGEDIVTTSRERKKRRDEISAKLRPVAERLAQNEPLRMKLHIAWATWWREDDGKEAITEDERDEQGKKTDKTLVIKNATGWHARMRWLSNWILPRGKAAKDRSIRNVGGLSLTRIATIKSLYQVQKAFFTRPTPEGRQLDDGKPATAGEGFGQNILDTLEQMRENRVKQLASRIAEAALGIGIEQEKNNKKDIKRPRERINNPRFATCHAVVVENLTRYRPEEIRTRRENRQLMDWSAAKVKKYLAEACELNGLHLREVPAGYTSRQDSRTGAPGVRCSDIPVAEFVRQSGYLSKRIKNALENIEKGKGSAEDQFLREVYARWDDKNKSWRDTDGVTWTLGKDGKWTERNGSALDPKQKQAPKTVRIPQRGGEIFVSAEEKSPTSRGIQADLNAAANIGLRALLDPDWTGRWWYVPCDPREFKPVADKVRGSAVFQDVAALKSTTKKDDKKDSESNGKKKGVKKDKSREVINLWRDPSCANISDGWKITPEYWNQVQSRVVQNLRKQAGLDK